MNPMSSVSIRRSGFQCSPVQDLAVADCQRRMVAAARSYIVPGPAMRVSVYRILEACGRNRPCDWAHSTDLTKRVVILAGMMHHIHLYVASAFIAFV